MGGVIVPTDSLGAFRTLYYADAAVNFIRTIDSKQAINQIYFVGMPEILTVERWAGLIWRAAGNDCRISYVPRQVINRSDNLRNYSPPLTRPLANIYDLSKAQRDIGVVTTPVEEWVQATVSWYRDHYNGGDSESYRFRSEELSLASRWDEAYHKLVQEF
jgi:nucleoside-diphosphate-sugar epimerase